MPGPQDDGDKRKHRRISDPACATAAAKPECISICEVPISDMPMPPGIRLRMLIRATIDISATACAKLT